MPLLKPMGGMFLGPPIPPHMLVIWEFWSPAIPAIPPIPMRPAMPGITENGLFSPELPEPFSRAEVGWIRITTFRQSNNLWKYFLTLNIPCIQSIVTALTINIGV